MARRPDILTIGDVAAMFRVDPKTVARWSDEGKFGPDVVFRTLGGHRRFYRSKVDALIARGPNLPEPVARG